MIIRGYGDIDIKEIEDEFEMKVTEADMWKVDALETNPSYVAWGNDEDYMCDKSGGRTSPIELEDVSDLWGLDELNELVNFYFFLNRESSACPDCEYGYNSATDKLARTWYEHNCDFPSECWQHRLEQEEVQALFDKRCLRGYTTCPTAAEVNEESRNRALFFDSIDHLICTEARAKRLGVYGFCPTCHGNGYVYNDDYFSLGCQMWFIHPRKGASRGVRLNPIETEEDLERVYDYLRKAAARNAERFSKIPDRVGA